MFAELLEDLKIFLFFTHVVFRSFLGGFQQALVALHSWAIEVVCMDKGQLFYLFLLVRGCKCSTTVHH